MAMKVEVWFDFDNVVTIRAISEDGEAVLAICGITEEVVEELSTEIEHLENVAEAMKVALARILYTPISWG